MRHPKARCYLLAVLTLFVSNTTYLVAAEQIDCEAAMTAGKMMKKNPARPRHKYRPLRITTISPEVHVAAPARNLAIAIEKIRAAAADGAQLILFPELSMTGYTAADLFHNADLIQGAHRALAELKERTKPLEMPIVVGAPYLAPNGKLYNVAFVLRRGKILGAVPKTYLPNYKEFYEWRWFQSGKDVRLRVNDALLGSFVLTPDQVFDFRSFVLGIEICEDVWAPLPPSRILAIGGATVIVNLSASNETIGKANYRRDMLRDLSAHHDLSYIYVSSGPSESTTDLVFGGHAIFAQRGTILAESERFVLKGQMTTATVGVDLQPQTKRATDRILTVKAGSIDLGTETIEFEENGAKYSPFVDATPAWVPPVEDAMSGVDWSQHGYVRAAVVRHSAGIDLAEVFARNPSVVVIVADGDLSAENARALRESSLQHPHTAVVLRGPKDSVSAVSRSTPFTYSHAPDRDRKSLGTLALMQGGALRVGVVTGDERRMEIPESTVYAEVGVQLILAFGGEIREDTRRFVEQQSGRLNIGYLFVADRAADGKAAAIFAENGTIFSAPSSDTVAYGEFDRSKIDHERIQNRTHGVSKNFDFDLVPGPLAESLPIHSLGRSYGTSPFVPRASTEIEDRSRDIIEQQAVGLARRLLASRTRKVSLGLSGGSDSTLAFIIILEACKLLDWNPAEHIELVSMPGFGTTERTLSQSRRLAAARRVPLQEIDIRPMSLQLLRAQNHPIWDAIRVLPLKGMAGVTNRAIRSLGGQIPDSAFYNYVRRFPHLQDVGFENSQARPRTEVLMQKGFVVGTGDMSESALGWATYNADHMSMYNPNASIPKTLVKHLIRWYAQLRADGELRQVLLDVADTVISPELKSTDEKGDIAQATEDSIGPYVLHDFFLFHFIRNGSSFRKIYDLACREFSLERSTAGPSYSPEEIRKWLGVFAQRFFAQQYKRTVMPAGPKVGSVSLSPRGDWRMPDEVDASGLVEEISKY